MSSTPELAFRKTAAESVLSEKDHWLRLMFNSSPDMVAVVQVQPGPVFRVVTVNPMYLEVVRGAGFNVAAADLAGKTVEELVRDFFKFDPAVTAEIVSRYVLVTRTLQPLRYEEITDTPKGRFYGDSCLTPIRDSSGRCAFVVYTSRDITERKRTEAELQASRDKLRALAARLQIVREEERTRAAREIHDVLSQELTMIKLEIAWFKRHLTPPLERLQRQPLARRLAAMTELTDKAIQSVQKIATELRPVILDTMGLVAAIGWQAREFQARTGISCEMALPEKRLTMDRDRSTALFRILQESLTNVVRHAGAKKVEVQFQVFPDHCVLTIRDDGRGVSEEQINDPHSAGLLGMRERAAAFDGEFKITGMAGEGTTVEVRLALPPADQPGQVP